MLAACGGAPSQPSPETRTAGSPGPSAAASSPPTAGPSASETTSAPTGNPQAKDLVTGLTSPWGLVALSDGTLLVSERDTRKIVHVDGADSTPVATLSDVDPGGEGGLLGLVITPDQKTLFAYYSAARDNRIVSMSWDGAALGEPQVVFDDIPRGFRHNGGRMVIGEDGYLYVGTGEVGQEGLAQDKESLAGKILRITQDGRAAPGNPFGNPVYSYGHRNVEGLTFDDAGRLWASEFGDQTWDELNLITKGANYGWPEIEGSGRKAGMTNPKVVWRTSEASPAGLAFWQGDLWMAALRGRRLWQIPLDATSAGEPKAHFTSDFGRLRTVAVAADGKSLLLTSSNTDGRGDPDARDDRVLQVTR